MEKTIVTAESGNRKVVVEIPWDSSLDELFDAFFTLAMGLGYHPDSWKTRISTLNDELNPTDEGQHWDFIE